MVKANRTKRKDATIRERHCVIGIDPGLSGGIAVYDAENDKIITVIDMPIIIEWKGRKKKKNIDAKKLHEWLADMICEYQVCAIAIEKVASSPQQGVASAFSFGKGFGILCAVAETLHPNVVYAAPVAWKARMGVTSDKKKTVERAQKLFGASPWFTKVSKDGVAEAALIAYYAAKDLVQFEVDPLS